MDDDDIFPALPADIKSRVDAVRDAREDDTQTKPAYVRRLVYSKLGRDEISVAEHRTLELVCQGLQNAEVAAQCFLSVETVKTHMQHMLRRCQCENRAQLAYRYGHGELTVVEVVK